MIGLEVRVDVSDAERVFKRLTDPALDREMAEAVADEVVLPALAKYPPKSGKPQPPRSAAQRRKVFALIKEGKIPYQRTGRTGRSYTKQPTAQGVDVASNLPSAQYTRGPGQAAYHRGNWDTHEELAEKLEGDAALAATAVIVEAIGGL